MPMPMPMPMQMPTGLQTVQGAGAGMRRDAMATATATTNANAVGTTGSAADYATLMRSLESKRLTNEYQGQPQNLRASPLPTLVGSLARAQSTGAPPSSNGQGEATGAHMEEVAERLTLMLNLMTEGEVQKTVEALSRTLDADPKALPLLANMIVKRAISEPNHHKLYIKVAAAVDRRELQAAILAQTYATIKNLLAEHKDDPTPPEAGKKAMKNLGSFLGALTIAENRPILAKDLDLKKLIIEAYAAGTVTLPILLLCPILRHIRGSRVFTQNNPWVRAMLTLLTELKSAPVVTGSFGLHYELITLYDTIQLRPEDFPPTNLLPTPRPVPKVLPSPSL